MVDRTAGEESRPDRITLTDGLEVAVLYPDLCYAPLETVGELSASAFAAAVLDAWPHSTHTRVVEPGTRGARLPLVSLIVTTDQARRFHPDLSVREPVELQVWPDGALSLEIEFVGEDVRTLAPGRDVLREVLSEWADAWGSKLLALYNDRGRSLPEVWNARFAVPEASAPVGAVIEFGERAIRVAEFHHYGVGAVEQIKSVLRGGDAHVLVGLTRSAVLEFRADLPGDDDSDRMATASEVCALANSVHGGLIVFGIAPNMAPEPDQLATVRPVRLAGGVERVTELVRDTVFPPPDGMVVEAVPVADAGEGEGLVFMEIPPQDRALKPFLVHGAEFDGVRHTQFVSIVERRDGRMYAKSIAALHAEIAAGRALLRGRPNS